MSVVAPSPLPQQPITLAMRALHRLDGTLPFTRHPLRNDRPVLTVAFDDIPDSAATAGAAVLEAAGVRGTFYVAAGLMGRDGSDWRHADAAAVAALARRGHEIGLHSFRHAPAAHLGRRAFADDLARGRAALETLLPGAALDNYALPYGFADPLHRPALARATRSCRTTHPGCNVGAADPYRLLSHPLGAGLRDDAHVARLLDGAVSARGWLILTLHDVRPDPSPYGCTAAVLARAVEGAQARGMAVATVGDALDLCGLPERPAP